MFNLSNWLRDNLIQACRERSFTVAQVNLMAFNYYQKGQLTQEDFDAVIVVTAEVQAEIEREQTEQQEQTEEQQEPTEPIEEPSIDEPI